MHNLLSRLILYHGIVRDPVLHTFAMASGMAGMNPGFAPEGDPRVLPLGFPPEAQGIPFGRPHDFGPGCCRMPPEMLSDRVHDAVRQLLETATSYAFDKNLWRDYLTFLLLTDENPFSLTAEKKGIGDGSVRHFACRDMEIFCRLFLYDFTSLEKLLGTDCFSVITDYRAVPKRTQNFNKNVSLRVREVSDAISEVIDREITENSSDEAFHTAAEKVLDIISDFYLHYGVGMFGLNRAFRIQEYPAFPGPEGMPVRGPESAILSGPRMYGPEGAAERIAFTPINNTEEVRLSDLVGYELQKQKLRDNTEAFLRGCRANNCLLYGDAGTGKSTSIKALITEYYDRGLRMIELYKHQMQSLSAVIGTVKHRNYKFIIYMDDLSFEDFEVEYKYLKAVIEGGLESRPDNVLIYATSNRRHLIKETWNDTSDVDLEKHRGDTLQEKLSLVDRFGITIPYMKPSKKEYMEIVRQLAGRNPELKLSEEELLKEAQKWEMSHGGFSGRVAQQFVDDLAGRLG